LSDTPSGSISDAWQVFDLHRLVESRKDDDVSFQEFLNVESMHCGLYHLKKGSKDMQTPHDEDEMYYVIEGRAKLRINGAEQDVNPGTLLYIKASEEHAFFEITEDMTLLVIFA
jgi:mannose-6-phosphate isomerase-like protein (cupin superfamily)